MQVQKTLPFFWILQIMFNGLHIPFIQCHLFASYNVNVEHLANAVNRADLDIFLTDYYIQMDSVGHLKSYIGEYNKIRSTIKSDGDKFLTNPINEYLLVRRLFEWNQINELLDKMDLNNTSLVSNRTDKGKIKGDFLLNELSARKLLPTDEDATGAALGLLRLQVTYKLDTLDMADGRIVLSGFEISSSALTAQDCWQLGEQSYMIGQFDYAISWLKESLKRYHKEEYKTVRLDQILQYYVFASYKQGQFDLASELAEQLLKLMSHQGQTETDLRNIFDASESQRAHTQELLGQEDHNEDYSALCRGEKLMEIETEAQLHCSYTSGNSKSAFLKLQPVKKEQISLNPYIAMFYDIISDKDIETVKEIAKPKMGQAFAINAFTETGFASQRRVSEITRLTDKNYSVLQRMSRRVEDVTGHVVPDWSKILSYGVGGHFSPHCDYNRNKTVELKNGNDLATLIFYLNEIEIGGSTVFPIAKSQVKPVKGSAAFWYNLNPDGEGDPVTLHASCPILSGSKWVIVKPINTHEQTVDHRLLI